MFLKLNKRVKEVDIKEITKDNPYSESLFQFPMTVDLRICMTCNDGTADVELHVIDPDGEKCYAMHNLTKNGGILSSDCMGYGPEVFMLRTAKAGQYKVFAKLFFRQNQNAPVTARLTIEHQFSQPHPLLYSISTILYQDKQLVEVASINIP
eukprot:TRINITY_DN13586_c0_g2_i2.p1 TRINITY_DN13586_c0_g2~~TRINITY_DN13586_c0_g2_i2.p1  ORF type:complete len:152 (+),score=37.73 TRINITY_DN13586_c0_g2_i2:176-631(+)